ncbi:hypothetical protein NOK12_30750 [Nocardioides sp. OK12]|uniref:hypothetical protein n=1 Tax=Nocardioides sp. OK12 TaxID=2758661 RepID=UPI0021C27F45|nr:hypothetical protein [Nocardioides sp. OK12]GHJ60557.1 hypothetical protein NOK12_30750 [Nocardioides sp. OK12]
MTTALNRLLAAPLAGLLAAGLLGAAGGAPATGHTGDDRHDASEHARTWAKDQVLRKGCRDYSYRYRVNPPTDQAWGLETFLVAPGGRKLASGALSDNADQKKGRDTFTVCRTSTRPGKFRIRAKLTYYDGFTAHDGWADTTRFRLRRR